VPGLSTFFENAPIHGEMWLVDCTGLAFRLFQQRRRWNRRMINEDVKGGKKLDDFLIDKSARKGRTKRRSKR
jgi:hypothetical protein